MNRIALAFLTLGLLATGLQAQTTAGTWTLYPPQATTTQLSIDQPINADGSSVWSAKATVPVQYDVLTGYGPVQFESLLSAQGTNVYPQYSTLDFALSTPVTFDQITNLNAVYQFTTGTCYGGSMRWSVTFDDGTIIYVYYGKSSTFWQDCSSVPSDPTIDQSGLNMVNANFDGAGGDARYEIQGTNTYTTYAKVLDSVTLAGAKVTDITLVLDGGWHADQIVSLGHVTVNDNTFVPKSGGFTAVCATAPATIQVSKIGASGPLTIDESLDSTVPDQGTSFRIVGCKYQYNIPGKSLGAGQYQVNAIINGVPAVQTGSGTQFALK
jgi:hypothetical protein